MKAIIVLFGLLFIPVYFVSAQVDTENKNKDTHKTVYMVISHIDCYDCQGTGYLNKVSYNFNRTQLGHETHDRKNNLDLQIRSIVCPYCGGKGKLEITQYKNKL